MKQLFCTFFCYLVATTAAQTLNTSLTACYDLNANASEPINNLTGTVSVATATVDRFNNPASALRFNGTTNCYVQLPDNPLIKPASALSFALWVRPEATTGGMHIVYTKNNQSSNFEAYQFEIFNGTVFRLNKANSTLNDIVLSTTTITAGQWYHVVCTLDNTSLKLYVNGILEGTTNSTFNGFDYMTGKQVYIGATNESFNHPFLGSIDNLKFWNRIITQTEITQLYQTDPSCTSVTPPVATFIASSNTACANNAITFTSTSSNNPNTFNWQVTGAASFTANVQVPTFTFTLPGIYSVSLTVSNSGGNNTAVQNVSIYPNPVITIIPEATLVCKGVPFYLEASGANTYSWSTSQTGNNIQVNPIFVNTVYTVTGNSSNGCASGSSVSIQVKDCQEVSLREENPSATVNFFPNPVRETLSLKSPIALSISLYDSIGSLLLTRQLNNEQPAIIDMSVYSSGIYFLKDETGTLKPLIVVKE